MDGDSDRVDEVGAFFSLTRVPRFVESVLPEFSLTASEVEEEEGVKNIRFQTGSSGGHLSEEGEVSKFNFLLLLFLWV